MSAYQTYTPRSFYRSADRAVLGGVCAGVADYFGFNLRVLRFLAIIAFVMAMPMAVIAYLAVVFLIPARSGTGYERAPKPEARQARKTRKERKCERKQARKEARQQEKAAPNEAAIEVQDKCQSLDKRLADLEKYITSPRYQLDREIRNL
jgi:phage shock protein C